MLIPQSVTFQYKRPATLFAFERTRWAKTGEISANIRWMRVLQS
jgi:hypothetical protein